MGWEWTPSAIGEIITAAALAAVAVYFPWQERDRLATRLGISILLVTALWLLFHGLEVGSTMVQSKYLLNAAQFLCAVAVPTIWLIYILRYGGQPSVVTRRTCAVLAIVPCLALALATTNQWHSLLWGAPVLNAQDPFLPVEAGEGIVALGIIIYSYILILTGAFVVIHGLVCHQYLRSREAGLVISAICLPLVVGMFDGFGVSHFRGMGLGLTPLSFAVSSLVLVWYVPRLQLGNMLPIARGAIIDGMADTMIVLDLQNRVVDLNLAAERLTGRTITQAFGKTIEELWPGLLDLLSISRPTSTVDEGVSLRTDGTGRTYDVSISGVVDHNQKKVGRAIVLRDMTERIQMKEALDSSQRKYHSLVENSGVGIASSDAEGKFTFVNRTLCGMLGYAEEELIGQLFADFVHAADREKVMRSFSDVYADPKSKVGLEWRALHKEGHTIYMHTSTTYLKTDNDTAVFNTIMTDITERKKMELERRELEQKAHIASRLATVGQMASGIVHEINNPLTSVIGIAQLLLMKDIPEDVRKDLEIIDKGGQQVASIVKRLLTFARQQTLSRELVNINDVIISMIELRGYELKTSNIEVVTEFDPQLPMTMADAAQLRQVFLNLILNAETEMKQAHGKGNLHIKTETTDGVIRVSMKDDGPGISKENLEKIFDPFFTTKKAGQGTGLGLSVCYGIMAEHNGRIYAESELGYGATFIVELPVIANAWQLKLAEPSVDSERTVSQARILVVDDEPVVLDYLGRLLREDGYAVEVTSRAKDALFMIQSDNYSLILLDIKMPEMSGTELYQRICKIDQSLGKKVVFVTGDVIREETKAFISDAKTPCFTKPFDAVRLRQDISQILVQGTESFVENRTSS